MGDRLAAGLYGPGRIPHWEAVKAGLPLPMEAEGYLNWIHVEAQRSLLNPSCREDPAAIAAAGGSGP